MCKIVEKEIKIMRNIRNARKLKMEYLLNKCNSLIKVLQEKGVENLIPTPIEIEQER
jgi:hypothetical protein